MSARAIDGDDANTNCRYKGAIGVMLWIMHCKTLSQASLSSRQQRRADQGPGKPLVLTSRRGESQDCTLGGLHIPPHSLIDGSGSRSTREDTRREIIKKKILEASVCASLHALGGALVVEGDLGPGRPITMFWIVQHHVPSFRRDVPAAGSLSGSGGGGGRWRACSPPTTNDTCRPFLESFSLTLYYLHGRRHV